MLRILCVIGALALLGKCGAAWQRSYSHGGQRDRYAALGLFALIAIGTELSNLGDIASWRLFVGLFAVLLALRGLRRFDHEQPSVPG